MNALRGTTALTGLALRRDRFRLSAYVLGLAVLLAGMLAGIGGQSREALADEAELFASTPALRIFGVASGASEGATTMIRGYLLLAVLVALISTLTVVRHTRQNEETGRAELVGAAVVGRHAGLAAALILRHRPARTTGFPKGRSRALLDGSGELLEQAAVLRGMAVVEKLGTGPLLCVGAEPLRC